ncbi:riboflavin synthase [Arthrospira sp. O9.13F]|nr:riboflavin synthase [Arthrospira sp. O9.13F]
MFTGLIQALGTIESLGRSRFQIDCQVGAIDLILGDLAIGDSVAVNGVCLTVVEIMPRGLVAEASPETLGRTTLGSNLNGYVNLEASLRAGSKLGGHFVTGHVDAIATLEAAVSVGNSWEMRFVPPSDAGLWNQQIAPYLVAKGSIAVNGVSLTISECDRHSRWFAVAVIPHTYQNTNLCTLETGSLVNLEADILGKYVAKFLSINSTDSLNIYHQQSLTATPEITPEFLSEHGFN